MSDEKLQEIYGAQWLVIKELLTPDGLLDESKCNYVKIYPNY